ECFRATSQLRREIALTTGAGMDHHPRMEFASAKLDQLSTYGSYLRSLSSPIDSFTENAILESEFYRIGTDGCEAGLFAINDGTGRLTQFHLIRPARRQSQAILARIFAEHAPTSALVASCDEFMLSHLVDREHELHRLGYMFVEASPQPPAPGAGGVGYR